MCRCDFQCNFSPQMTDKAWLCSDLCSHTYHPPSSDLSSLIMTLQPHLVDRLLACNGLPCRKQAWRQKTCQFLLVNICDRSIKIQENVVLPSYSPHRHTLSLACTFSGVHSNGFLHSAHQNQPPMNKDCKTRSPLRRNQN